jgi:hypothetical protein
MDTKWGCMLADDISTLKAKEEKLKKDKDEQKSIDSYYERCNAQVAVDNTFSYGNMCYLTLPCQHNIVLRGRKYCASALTIIELYKRRNLNIPEHFTEQITRVPPKAKPQQNIIDMDI